MGLETIWRGRVERWTAGLCLVRTEAGLLAEVPAEAPPGERVNLTMRPEDVVLVSTADGGGPSRARGTAGADAWSRCRTPVHSCGSDSLTPDGGAGEQDGDPRAGFLVALVTRASAEALGLAPGRDIEARVKATALHVLKG